MFDVQSIRAEFPQLRQQVYGKPLVYFDNAATSQTPKSVVEAVKRYKERQNANPHRGAHYLGMMATTAYEGARERVVRFLNASSPREIIFTKNATEALNLVAHSYGLQEIKAGQDIVLCISEHHSNLVPWQKVANTVGASLRYLYLTEDFRLDWDEVKEKVTQNTGLVAIAQMSNVLGTIYPVKELIAYAHGQGAVVVVDGAQSVPHLKTDVQKLDADFFVFSGHKVFAPMGIGVLYGKQNLLEQMQPFLLGGEMVEFVQEQTASFNELPYKFEAGTPNVEGAVGLAAALDFLEGVGFETLASYEQELTRYALSKLRAIPQITIYGPLTTEGRGPVIAFELEGCHPHDVATIVDQDGIALRAGHHCAQPLGSYLGAPATSRISFSFYNTKEEIDYFIQSLKGVRRWLGYES